MSHLARAYAPLNVEPVEAGYAMGGDGVAVTPGREGQKVEEEKLLDAGSEWVTHQRITRNGEVVFDGVLHRDTYEPLVDGKDGGAIPPSDIPGAP